MFGVKKKFITKEDSSFSINDSHYSVTFKPKPQFSFNFKVSRRIWLGLGSVFLVSISGGLVYGKFFIEQQLAPILEKELTDFLNRPVKIGSVQGISLTGVRFGKSEILPTLRDPAKISLLAVDVSFNPLKFFTSSQLGLDVKAIQPNIYLEQGVNGSWLLTPFDVIKSSGAKKEAIELETLHFVDANLIVTARSAAKKLQSPVKLFLPSAKLDFINQGRIIDFAGIGQLSNGGRVKFSGVSKTKTEEINLLVTGHRLNANELKNLIPLPVALETGEIGANLEVKLKPKQLPSLKGVATLNRVSAKVPQLPQAFTQINGLLRFNQTGVKLENVTTQFGKISGVANGSIDLRGGYDLSAKILPFQVQDALNTLKVSAPSVNIAAKLQSDIQIKGSLKNPQVSLNLITTESALVDQINFKSIAANFQLSNSGISLTKFQALPSVGGELSGQGKIAPNSSTFAVDVQAKNLPSQEIARLYKTIIPSSVGQVSGQFNLAGKLNNSESWQGTGTANFPLGKGKINLNQVEYVAGNWQGQLQASDVELADLGINLPENIPHGRVNAQLNLSGNQDLTADNIIAKGAANLSIADGNVSTDNLQLVRGKWKTNLQVEGIKVNHLVTNIPNQLDGRVAGNFTIEGDLNSSLTDIQAKGEGQLTIPSGTINADELQLNGGEWQANLQTENLKVARLIPDVPTPLQGKIQGTVTLSGNLESSLEDIQGTGQARLISSSGTITAQNIQLKQGNFKTLLTPEQIKLASFSPQLKGYLGGNLNISGQLNNINPSTIKAQGKLDFSQGISLIDSYLTTRLNWQGKRLEIIEATANNFNAKGFLEVDLLNKNNFLSALKKIDLDINTKNLDLKQLTSTLPFNKINHDGQINFTGKIAGTPEKPNLDGEVILTNLRLANQEFEPVLNGSISHTPDSGVQLNLSGDEDKIELQLNEDYQPVDFALNVDRIAVEGTYQEQQILVNANNIPLELLAQLAAATDVPIPEKILSQPIKGELSGKFAFDVNKQNFSGENVAIVNPGWGHIQGDHFTGDISIKDGDFSLSKGQFQHKNSLYDINANVTQSPSGPRLQTELTVTEGKIEDVLETLQIFELSDFKRGLQPPTYAKAKDLWTQKQDNSSSNSFSSLYSVGLPGTPLAQQLEYFAQINSKLEKTEQKKHQISLLPELRELQGKFNGKVTLNVTMQTGIEATFDVKGQNWQWGDLNFQQLQAKGDFKNGLLNLEPVSINLNDSLLAFSGQINNQSQSGTLQLQKVPLNLVQKFVPLAPGAQVGGLLNAQINVSGKRDNPDIRGQLAISEASFNQIPIQTTQGEFTYHNSRLKFQAGMLPNQTTTASKNLATPIKIEGSLPYQLPFAKVVPRNDNLNLNIQIENEGLALLDVFTKGQVSWRGGRGEINLDIDGKFDSQQGRPTQLKADGIATLENATIAAQIFPDVPLTGVNGKIFFNFDQIQVEKLAGNFSGGQIEVAGTLPLLLPIPVKEPLTIKVDNLALNLKELYQGNVDGNIQVAGSVLNPKLGGEVNLFNGQILLNESIKDAENPSIPAKGLASLTQLKNLQLNLGDNVWISLPPVLKILATGNVNVNGNLAQPRPEGDIKLKGGQINLFSAQFGLVGGEVNTARFMPNRGLDPYLDIKMTAVVSETSRNVVRTNPLSSEINDNTAFPSDSLQTVRVEAKIDGFASQLSQNLEVSSLPPRSKNEIIALLGGNFINPFVETDPRLGLANLAGSAVFGTIQGPISKVLGLSDFRVYPTQVLNEKDRINNYQIGIAAEASVDIRDNLSVSLQKLLNTDRPPDLGLRYRINNNTVIRGTSNFSDDNRGMIEYQRRF